MFDSARKRRKHTKVCPYVLSRCVALQCRTSQHLYTQPQLHHHLNHAHNIGIGEIPSRLITMRGEDIKKAKEGVFWFSWDGLFDFGLRRSFQVFVKFDGFLFTIQGKAKMTSKHQLYGYGSVNQEEFIVAAANFIGVEGLPKKYQFSLQFHDPTNANDHEPLLEAEGGMGNDRNLNQGIRAPIQKGCILRHDWRGQEVGIPTSIARGYQATRDLKLSVCIEKLATRKWRETFGPLTNFHDFLIMR